MLLNGISFDDKYISEDGAVTLYFTGPKEYLKSYFDLEYTENDVSMEISIEFPDDTLNTAFASVMVSPTDADGSDYDWNDVLMDYNTIVSLVYMYEAVYPLNLSSITFHKMEELEDKYCLCMSQGRYFWDSDLERLFHDSKISTRTLNKSSKWKIDSDGTIQEAEEGELLETLLLEQNGKNYTCQVYAQDNGVALNMALDITHVKELGKTWGVKSVEATEGEEEYFLLYVPKEASEEEIQNVLHMASCYAINMEDMDIKKGIKTFDKHYAAMRNWPDENGQFRFNYYIRYCIGWYIEPIIADYTYTW